MCLTACQKKDTTPTQPDAVTMDIASPTQGQIVKKGEVVNINASVNYIAQMHGYIVKIVDGETGEIYFETEGHVHGDYFIVTEKWTNTLSDKRSLLLQITAIVDHENNEKTQSVSFISQP